jgi:hypothetical protein
METQARRLRLGPAARRPSREAWGDHRDHVWRQTASHLRNAAGGRRLTKRKWPTCLAMRVGAPVPTNLLSARPYQQKKSEGKAPLDAARTGDEEGIPTRSGSHTAFSR